jgi:hypothetical protein
MHLRIFCPRKTFSNFFGEKMKLSIFYCDVFWGLCYLRHYFFKSRHYFFIPVISTNFSVLARLIWPIIVRLNHRLQCSVNTGKIKRYTYQAGSHTLIYPTLTLFYFIMYVRPFLLLLFSFFFREEREL